MRKHYLVANQNCDEDIERFIGEIGSLARTGSPTNEAVARTYRVAHERGLQYGASGQSKVDAIGALILSAVVGLSALAGSHLQSQVAVERAKDLTAAIYSIEGGNEMLRPTSSSRQ